MKLFYYKGKNFGDAINPLLLGKLFPDFFDDNESDIFIGIGSILGLVDLPEKCKNAIIFSSGYADSQESTYGKPPKIDARFDVVSVRGKLTASKIGISETKGLGDGALLLPLVFDYKKIDSERIRFMPHHGTLEMYPAWKKLAKECGIDVIDPSSDPLLVIEQICSSKKVLAEAMHGAIACDAYRVPWVAVKTTKLINSFKWNDYLGSVNLHYKPFVLPTLYSLPIIQKTVFAKLSRFRLSMFSKPVALLFYVYQQTYKVARAKRFLKRLKLAETMLCTIEVLEAMQKQLLNCVDLIKAKYNRNK